MYYDGIIPNIELIKQYYPDYWVYIYVGNEYLKERIEPLYNMSNIKVIHTGVSGAENMMYRFFAIDDADVEVMHVRDLDSRIHVRDRWCIDKFMTSNHNAYTIRDNNQHGTDMMGGLWGCKRTNIHIKQIFDSSKIQLYKQKMVMGYDQDFLRNYIYPKLKSSFIDFGLFNYRNSQYFMIPKDLAPHLYCGAVSNLIE